MFLLISKLKTHQNLIFSIFSWKTKFRPLVVQRKSSLLWQRIGSCDTKSPSTQPDTTTPSTLASLSMWIFWDCTMIRRPKSRAQMSKIWQVCSPSTNSPPLRCLRKPRQIASQFADYSIGWSRRREMVWRSTLSDRRRLTQPQSQTQPRETLKVKTTGGDREVGKTVRESMTQQWSQVSLPQILQTPTCFIKTLLF